MVFLLTRLTLLCVMIIHGVWGCSLHHVHRGCGACVADESGSAATPAQHMPAAGSPVTCCSQRVCHSSAPLSSLAESEKTSSEPPAELPVCCERDACTFLATQGKLELLDAGWSPCPLLLHEVLQVSASALGLTQARQFSGHLQLAEPELQRRCALIQTWLI